MSYPEFHHIGFKIISTFFMIVTIKQNEQKLEDLRKIKLALEKKAIKNNINTSCYLYYYV